MLTKSGQCLPVSELADCAKKCHGYPLQIKLIWNYPLSCLHGPFFKHCDKVLGANAYPKPLTTSSWGTCFKHKKPRDNYKRKHIKQTKNETHMWLCGLTFTAMCLGKPAYCHCKCLLIKCSRIPPPHISEDHIQAFLYLEPQTFYSILQSHIF